MAFWGVEVKSGKPYTHSPDKAIGRLRITQATLGTAISVSNNNILVQCNVGKKSPVLMCRLFSGFLETCHLELEFEEVEGVTFSVLGSHSVHLTGYYVSILRKLHEIDQSESFGEDIGDTDAEWSDGCNHEDDYEDSFINDDELHEFPSSPSSDEVAHKNKKRKTKKKADSPKRVRRRLVLSESEDDAVPSEHETLSNHVGAVVVVSDDDDGLPISFILGNSKIGTEATHRKVYISDQDQSKERVKKRKVPTVSMVGEDQSWDNKVKPRQLEIDPCKPTLIRGVSVEELEIGDPDAKMASSGKKIIIAYTGKLKEGGHVFDSTIDKGPLMFRLGKGRVLVGLDIGIEGMRVGGKRRLIIPPELGFEEEGSELVPPNSWLVMDVELLEVII